MTPTLVIMAAGNSTRYGALKQFENVGLSNAYLFEYAIYDAIETGFKRVIFIIKKEYQQYFTELKKSYPNIFKLNLLFS